MVLMFCIKNINYTQNYTRKSINFASFYIHNNIRLIRNQNVENTYKRRTTTDRRRQNGNSYGLGTEKQKNGGYDLHRPTR